MQDQRKRETELLIEDAGRLSLLSHDIRTAYTEVHLGLAATLEQPVDPELHNALRRLHETSAHLGRLINEASALVYQEPAPTGPTEKVLLLKSTLMGLCDRWQHLYKRYGKHLDIIGLSDLPDRAIFDQFALERVLRNVISNALSHAEGKNAELKLSMEEAEGELYLNIGLRDEGSGFPAEVLAHETLSQPLPLSAGLPGSGFGLRVAFDATKRLGGTLTLRNTDVGAQVQLRFPLKESNARRNATAAAQNAFEGKTALVVEDLDVVRHLLVARLRDFGMTVFEASDGIEALDFMSRPGLDLCLIDAELPYLSGIQVLNILKERGIVPPPTIAITAHVAPALIEKIRNAGAQEVIGKPLPSSADLIAILQRALSMNAVDLRTPLPEKKPSNHRPLARLFASLPRLDAIDFLERLDADFDLYFARLEAIGDESLSPDARLRLDHVSHCLTGLFATAYCWEGHQKAQNITRRSESISSPELVALCAELRQDVKNIQDTIREIIIGETDPDVPNKNFSN